MIARDRSQCLDDHVHVLGADAEALQTERPGALSDAVAHDSLWQRLGSRKERAKLQVFADRGEGRRELREQGGSRRSALPDAACEHCDEYVDWCTCSRS